MPNGPEDQPQVDQTARRNELLEAAADFESAKSRLAADPHDVEAITDQAQAMMRMGAGATARNHFAVAATHYEEGSGKWIQTRVQIAKICVQEGLVDEALELLDGLERITDTKTGVSIRIMRARCFIRARRYDETRATIGEITRAGNLNISVHALLADLDVAEENHERARARLEQIARNPAMTGQSAAAIHFQLATILDRLGEYDEAFAAATRGNELLEADFDLPAFEAETEAILDWATPETIASLPISSDREARSVFIVGMPRSGTSLLEQIIAAHPKSDGIGERIEFNMYSTLLDHRTRLEFPRSLSAADPDSLDEFAALYRSMESSIAPTASRVTNKALGLDRVLPLISRVLPESHAILLRRRPLDNLLSIYMNSINPVHLSWACCLEGLIAARRRFERFTDRWADILDMKILPLDYEDLVDDAEGKITDVLEFLGIDFDRSSVDFHKSDRVVMTPSWNQVSRPMNRDAVDRWRRYERHLGPLIEAFGE